MNQHSPQSAALPDAVSSAYVLVKNGYQIVPVKFGTKRPIAKGWNKLEITAETVEEHFQKNTKMNIGLLTHDMPVLDIDVRDTAVSKQIVNEALSRWPGVLQRVGEAPKVALLFGGPGNFKKQQTASHEINDQVHQVEVLCRGQQVVAFGMHPDTKQAYKWIGDSPLDVAITDLPKVSEKELKDFLDWCDALMASSAQGDSTTKPNGSVIHMANDNDEMSVEDLKRYGKLKENEKAKQSQKNWSEMPDAVRKLECERLLKLVKATKQNTLNYEDWIALGHGLKSIFGDDGWPVWNEFSRKFKRTPEYVIEAKWDSFDPRSELTPGFVVEKLKKSGLSPCIISSTAKELAVARSRLNFENGVVIPAGETQTSFEASLFTLPDEIDIPRRRWLYGRFLIRGFLSLTVAPGGTGKSALAIAEALAMVTAKPLLNDCSAKNLRVWIWNGEDPKDELDRRLAAACKHYRIDRDHLGDRLMVDTGRKLPIKIASMKYGSIEVAEPIVKALIQAILESRIDVLIVDPFATSHLVPENDNGALNAVVDAWRRVADTTGCAVHLIHHVNKAAALNSDQGIYGSRGAGALIDGVRAARYLQKMTEAEAGKLGLDSAVGYIQLVDGKMNLAPPTQHAQWFKLRTVHLRNGDDVAVCDPWEPPHPLDGVSEEFVLCALRYLKAKSQPKRKNEQAHDWIGYSIAEAFDWNIGSVGSKYAERTAKEKASRARVRALIYEWTKNGLLKETAEHDSRAGRGTPCLKLGRAAFDLMSDDGESGSSSDNKESNSSA